MRAEVIVAVTITLLVVTHEGILFRLKVVLLSLPFYQENLELLLLGQSLLRGGPRDVAILCDMHSLVPVGIFIFLSMNDFLPGCLFAVVVINCFMIGVNV